MASKKKEESLLERTMVLGSSLVYLGKGAGEDLVKELEKRNLLKGKEGKQLATKLRSKVSSQREAAKNRVLKELKSVIGELGIATKQDIKNLQKKTTKSSKK